MDYYLHENSPIEKYNKYEKFDDIIHWGQRKLFLTELEFLTRFGDKSYNIIYPGSAPGIHIPFLMDLFPKHIFYLIDPSDFCEELKLLNNAPEKERRVFIITGTPEGYFSDDKAKYFFNKFGNGLNSDTLFISDVRAADQNMTREEKENIILINNNEQLEWINILKPQRSLLKFRLPFPDSKAGQLKSIYPEGEIMLQPYAPSGSAETRLVPYDEYPYKIIIGNNKKYEEQLYYHNRFIRTQKFCIKEKIEKVGTIFPTATFPLTDRGKEGIFISWDNKVEYEIFTKYIKKFNKINMTDMTDMNVEIFKIIELLTKKIGQSGRTLQMLYDRNARRYRKKGSNHKDHYSNKMIANIHKNPENLSNS